MPELETDYSFNINMDTSEARKQLKLLNTESLNLGSSVKSAFESIAIKGRDVEGVFKSLALSLSRRAFSQAFQPINGLFDGIAGGAGGALANIFGFAKGGVFSGGVGASSAMGGGLLNSPVAFPLGGSGNIGVAGEAGPEAILPLARGADGALGVRAANTAPVNITINISTPDVEGFRRSQGEIAATLQQIVSRGNRNL